MPKAMDFEGTFYGKWYTLFAGFKVGEESTTANASAIIGNVPGNNIEKYFSTVS